MPRRAARLVVAALSAAALTAAVLLAVPQTSSAAPARPTVSPANAVAGEPVVVRVRAPGRVKRPVLLQRSVAGRWRTVARARTSARGEAALRFTAAAATVRIVAPRAKVRGRTYAAWASSTTRVVPRVVRTRLVSRDQTGGPIATVLPGTSISSDGRWVAFATYEDNVVAGDVNGMADVFVADTRDGTVVQVSHGARYGDGDGPSFAPSISADGSLVAFTSFSTTFDVADTNGASDIYLWHRTGDYVTRESVNYLGQPALGNASEPALSADGRHLAYTSTAIDVTGRLDDRNGSGKDVFTRDLRTGVTRRVSLGPEGSTNGEAFSPAIDRDGSHIAFVSDVASGLYPGDVPGDTNVLVWTSATRRNALVSVGSTNARFGAGSDPTISADGRRVAYVVPAPSPGGGPLTTQIYLRDLRRPRAVLVSIGRDGRPFGEASQPSLDASGRHLAFYAVHPVAPGASTITSDVFVRRLDIALTSLVSANRAGRSGNGRSYEPVLDRTGDRVVFLTLARDITGAPASLFPGFNVVVADRRSRP
ncbi:TolB family protein [Aeromicrobium sp.]|uniref:TolB family protein n=1 Tax=Aeromicrobium sp. TaxID=1871063 RepID=UPI0035168A2B